jgi:hypothetical protein
LSFAVATEDSWLGSAVDLNPPKPALASMRRLSVVIPPGMEALGHSSVVDPDRRKSVFR